MEDRDHWVELFTVLQRIEKINADLTAVRKQRDKIIADIHHSGVPVAQIARRAGLSRPTIHTIVDQQREA